MTKEGHWIGFYLPENVETLYRDWLRSNRGHLLVQGWTPQINTVIGCRKNIEDPSQYKGKLHTTLVYVGSIEEDMGELCHELREWTSSLKGSLEHHLALRISSIGYLPVDDPAQYLVWPLTDIGTETNMKISDLRAKLEEIIDNVGLPKDNYPLNLHITAAEKKIFVPQTQGTDISEPDETETRRVICEIPDSLAFEVEKICLIRTIKEFDRSIGIVASHHEILDEFKI